MKQILATIILLAISLNGFSQGVFVFKSGDIYDALEVAKDEKKLLLVEFYADWDYRSSWFNDMINKTERVSKRINEDFVFFQIDTKTINGASFANKYSVNGYPCLLIFNKNGDVISKIDKTLEPDDFLELIDNVMVMQSGGVVWRISQIDSAIENGDYNKADNAFIQLQNAVGDDIYKKQFWKYFEDNTVTFFTSASYGLLSGNRQRFQVDSAVVDSRIKSIIRAMISPFLIESQPFDLKAISIIKDEIVNLKIEDEISTLMLQMIDFRNSKNIGAYIISCEKLLELMEEDMGVSVCLTLEFIVDYGSKEQKRMVKKIIQNQIQKSHVGINSSSMQLLLDKF